MVHLEMIDQRNFYAVLSLQRPEGEPFVAPNSVSLAEAWLYRNEGTVLPRALYNGKQLVGFVMTHDDRVKRVRDIWRILIPEEFVNHGFGTCALEILIAEVRTDPDFDALVLSYVPGNAVAEHVYAKVGFRPTGAIDDGEIVMKYDVR